MSDEERGLFRCGGEAGVAVMTLGPLFLILLVATTYGMTRWYRE